MEINLNDFPTWLKNERKRRGFTQIELGEISDVQPNTICIYEHRRCYPDYKVFIKLLKGLGYSATIELKPLEQTVCARCEGCVFEKDDYCTKFVKECELVRECPYFDE